MEIHNHPNKKPNILKPVNFEINHNVSNFHSQDPPIQMKTYKEAYLNTPNVALFRVKFDTLAITMANKYFLDCFGYTSLEELNEFQIGLDEIIISREVPFVVEELEIFGEISKISIQVHRKNRSVFWTSFSGKASLDRYYIDCTITT